MFNKFDKPTYITLGIITMFLIAPFSSWGLGILYGAHVGDGFATIGVIIFLFAVLFLIGLALTVYGIFKKKDS